MYSQRLYQINQLPSTDVCSLTTAAVANAIIAVSQAATEVWNDLFAWMRYENKLDVLIHPQPRVGGNRVNQKRQATLIMLSLEMLKNRREHRALFIPNCVV